MTGIRTAFFAGSHAEINIVAILTITAAPTDRADTVMSIGTPDRKTAPILAETARSIRPIAPSPASTPMGIPIAPIQSPSKRTELRNCFAVAPTEARTPISRIRSLREILKEL